MGGEEFAKFAASLKTFYPRENLLPNREALALWYEQLKDIPYNVASAALNKWVSTERWSPTIADLRRLSVELTGNGVEDWGSAWKKVVDVIGFYGHTDMGKALAEVPEVAAEAVRQIGYLNLCMSENQVADRAHFQKVYEQIAEKERQKRQIPAVLRERIEKMQIGMIGKEDE